MPPRNGTLDAAVTTHRSLRDQLLAAFPELSEDDQALADSLEGISDFKEQCLAVMRLAIEQEALAEAIPPLIKRLQERKQRLEGSADKKRAIVLHAMTEAGEKKIVGPDLTLSTSWGKAPLIITEPDKVPDELCKVQRTPKKTEIVAWLNELDAMSKPAWATLGNPRMKLTVTSR